MMEYLGWVFVGVIIWVIHALILVRIEPSGYHHNKYAAITQPIIFSIFGFVACWFLKG